MPINLHLHHDVLKGMHVGMGAQDIFHMAGFSSESTRFGGKRNHLTILGAWVTLTAGVNKLVGDVGC